MKDREHIFDVLRIVSMFLVILIHISNFYMRRYSEIGIGDYAVAGLFNSISRVAVPIFFMISGALLLDKAYDLEKYKKRIFKFLGILIFWSIIYVLWDKFYLKEETNILNLLLTSFFSPVKAHLWFMYAIIGIYIVLPFIQILIRNMSSSLEKLFIGLWIVFSGVVYIYRIILSVLHIGTTIEYPIPLVQATYYLGYFVVGYIVYKKLLSIKNLKQYNGVTTLIFIVSTLITFIGTMLLSSHKDLYYESLFGYRSLFIIISSISVYCLFIMNKERIEKIINVRIVEELSKYSLGIYLVHVIYLNLLSDPISYIPSCIGIPLFGIIIFCLSFTTIWLLSRIKYLRELI